MEEYKIKELFGKIVQKKIFNADKYLK